jgi:hypothetical protein
MTTNVDRLRTPTLLDIAGVNPSDPDLAAQYLELLRSRGDKAAVLGYAKRLLAFTAQCRGAQSADSVPMKERGGREDRDLRMIFGTRHPHWSSRYRSNKPFSATGRGCFRLSVQ